jgi:hypothetical protein
MPASEPPSLFAYPAFPWGTQAMQPRSATASANCAFTMAPGYRIYFQRQRETIVLLLCGGDKSTQAKDITKAKGLAKEWSK